MTGNLSFPGLVSGGWRACAYEPFRNGIEAHWLLRSGPHAPSSALLRYRPGATVPLHRHPGLETIVVLDGIQSDENGDYPAGSVIFNPVDSVHSVWTETGCTVWIQWNLPVVILGEET